MSENENRYGAQATQANGGENGRLNRREFFGLSALTGLGAALGMLAEGLPAAAQSGGAQGAQNAPITPLIQDDPSIVDLQAQMASGKLTSVKLVNLYLSRIAAWDKTGPALNAIMELNPDAREIAEALDDERRRHGPRGPLHGIPILLKDNVDTGDKMQTTAGSWALFGTPAPRDSTTAARLRAAGAVILGKTNLTEFANFRSFYASSGWSGRGGQTRNPYVLNRNPLGSSAGSGVAVSANLSTVAIGTETDGSIIGPAAFSGIVGIKPTLGLTSRAGVVPIAHSQDTVGPHGRSVADAAAVLGALVGVDPRDPATADSAGKFYTDYTQFLNPDGLRGARIGVMRKRYFGVFAAVDTLVNSVLAAMQAAGATIVDPADIPTIDAITTGPEEFNVLLYEFKRDLNAYLATRTGITAHTLADVIAFNQTHPEELLAVFDQIVLEMSQNDVVSTADYQTSLATQHLQSRGQGIDAIMSQYNLDALLAPLIGPSFTTDWVYGDHLERAPGAPTTPAAQAGYPIIAVPVGFDFGMPVVVTLTGRAWSEPTLIRIASGLEAITKARRPPQFIPAIETYPSGGHTHPRVMDAQSAKAFYEDAVKNKTTNRATGN